MLFEYLVTWFIGLLIIAVFMLTATWVMKKRGFFERHHDALQRREGIISVPPPGREFTTKCPHCEKSGADSAASIMEVSMQYSLVNTHDGPSYLPSNVMFRCMCSEGHKFGFIDQIEIPEWGEE